MAKNDMKTNVMRILDGKKIKYNAYTYDGEVAISGTEVAAALGQNPKQVFKTLVTVGKSNNHYVFVVPVECELNLKKAAKAVGEKSIEMIKQKEESDKRLLKFEWVIGVLSCIILFVPIFIAALLPMEEWKQLAIIFSCFIPGFIKFNFLVIISS